MEMRVSVDLESATLDAQILLVRVSDIESHTGLGVDAGNQRIILYGNLLLPEAEPFVESGMPIIPPWEAHIESLERAVRAVLACDAGKGFTTPGTNLQMALRSLREPGEQRLTPSEARVVFRAAHADSNRVIAQRLGISVHTVKTHLSNGMRKLGVSNRVQLHRAILKGPYRNDAE
ncbi:MAG: hypothetical protein DI611_15290 [Brachybacterium faecium]|nr:MAG: hypothetical protein DI611_15290 [Brachybacterium faecium]